MNFTNEIDPWALNREYKLSNVALVKRNHFNSGYDRDVFALKPTEIWEGKSGSWEGLDASGDLDEIVTYETSGSLEQTEPYDLETIFEFNIIIDLDFKNVQGGSITIQVSTSEDGTTFSAFANVDSATVYRAQYLKFKYLLVTSNANYGVEWYAGTIFINASVVKVDFGRDVLIAAGGTTILFRDDFTTPPRITGLSIVNGIVGVIEVVSKTATQMVLKVRDLSGVAIGTAEVDWEVKGG
jgi:hypothetical protein